MDKINIDFEVINTNNPKTMLIGDTSRWLHAESEPAYISITLPGYSKPKNFTFKKDSLQVFNSNHFELSILKTCGDQEYADLPDGVYTVEVTSGFENIGKKRYYLKTDKLDVEISKLIVKDSLEYSKSSQWVRDSVLDIKWNLIVAKSFTIESDIENATKYYNEAVDNFNKISC